MSYTPDVGEVSARYVPAEGADQVTLKSGTVARFGAPASTTNGQFGLFEWNMQPRSGGADAHFHKTFSESFYVLSGTVRLFNGADWVDAARGGFLHVPAGGIHGFRNDRNEPASMLILFAPGPPRELYFEALADIGASGRELSTDEWTELFTRHDQYRAE